MQKSELCCIIENSATWIAKPSDLSVHYPIIGMEVHIPKCYPNGENKTSFLSSLQSQPIPGQLQGQRYFQRRRP